MLSGSVQARNDNAFASARPIAALPARLALSRLQLPRNMEMIGGLHGRKPAIADMRRLADLLEKGWDDRHHEHKSYEQHFADVKLRFGTISAPTFVAYGSAGWPDAVLFPMRTSRTPGTDADILGSAYWNTDFAQGTILVVRKSASDTEFSAGLEKRLITEAFLPYARALAGIGEISNVLFYTWHLNGTFKTDVHARELEMHKELGAVPARTFAGGRIEEMIYSHLLSEASANSQIK